MRCLLAIALASCTSASEPRCGVTVLAGATGLSFAAPMSMRDHSALAAYHDGTLAAFACGAQQQLAPGATRLATAEPSLASEVVDVAIGDADDAYVQESDGTLLHLDRDANVLWEASVVSNGHGVVAAEGLYVVTADSTTTTFTTTFYAAGDGSMRWQMPGIWVPDGTGGTVAATPPAPLQYQSTITALDASLAPRWTKTISTTGVLLLAPPFAAPGVIHVAGRTVGMVGLGDQQLTTTGGFEATLDLATGATITAKPLPPVNVNPMPDAQLWIGDELVVFDVQPLTSGVHVFAADGEHTLRVSAAANHTYVRPVRLTALADGTLAVSVLSIYDGIDTPTGFGISVEGQELGPGPESVVTLPL